MTSGKKRQLHSFLTDAEKVELEDIENFWDNRRYVPWKNSDNETHKINERYSKIWANANRRRKISKLD